MKKRITLKFRYLEQEANSNFAILEAAKAQYGLKDLTEALTQILTEWAQEHGGKAATTAAAPKQTTAKPAAKAAPAKKAVARQAVAA